MNGMIILTESTLNWNAIPTHYMIKKDKPDKVTSLDLAGLLVDALIDGKCIKEEDREKAEEIIEEELFVSIGLGRLSLN